MELINRIEDGCFDNVFSKLYQDIEFARKRYINVFSSPGRTEICGNHTDHQGGKVIAGAIDYDIIAVAAKNSNSEIRIISEGYAEEVISLSELTPDEKYYSTFPALVRGIVSKMHSYGLPQECGFNAYITSDVPKGSGLSSSAAFEVLIGKILSSLFLEDTVDSIELAKIGQYSENVFFGKPCGLMDQLACSVGGVISVDFKDKNNPCVQSIDFDCGKYGYKLCIIDSRADHADLTDEYSAITNEMKSVAEVFGKDLLSEISEQDFFERIPELYGKVSDRAILRAMHYYQENDRVTEQINNISNNDIKAFLATTISSGRSSYMYLQNIFAPSDTDHQALSLLLAMCETLLEDNGAWRVHGGGFAGTVSAYVKEKDVENFKHKIDNVFGDGSCHIMNMRKYGVVCLDNLN